ncbi:MAG TPA: porin [Terriglobales bacterium]|nr:porin [Terriglobales bacterium]
MQPPIQLATAMVALFLAVSLEAQSGPPTPADAHATPAVVHTISFGHDGLLVASNDATTQLRVHGYLQADGNFFSSNLKNQSPDILLFRRIRPLLEGTLFNTLDFRFMPDFGRNNPQIQEAYVEVRTIQFAKPRIGKFKTPLGLEALRSDREATFAERSLASDLVPLREVGAQLSGSLLHDSISYAAGYFNGTTDGSNGNFQWRASSEGVARIFLTPFSATSAKAFRGAGAGIAASFAGEHGALPSFKTVGQNTFFKYSAGTAADGGHTRLSPQAYYYWGTLGLMGEYTISAQEVSNRLSARRLSNQAWQTTASIMLTGEKNSYAGMQPRAAFEPQKGIRHLGGWELAGRYSRLRVDANAFPLFADPKTAAAGATEWGVALNWYLNRFTRIMNAYEHTSFLMAQPKLAPLHSENVVMSRLQLAF